MFPSTSGTCLFTHQDQLPVPLILRMDANKTIRGEVGARGKQSRKSPLSNMKELTCVDFPTETQQYFDIFLYPVTDIPERKPKTGAWKCARHHCWLACCSFFPRCILSDCTDLSPPCTVFKSQQPLHRGLLLGKFNSWKMCYRKYCLTLVSALGLKITVVYTRTQTQADVHAFPRELPTGNWYPFFMGMPDPPPPRLIGSHFKYGAHTVGLKSPILYLLAVTGNTHLPQNEIFPPSGC